MTEKAKLVVDDEARLDLPLSADRSLPFRSYVLKTGSDGETVENIQTGLLDIIAQSQARLIDLRETRTSAQLGSLSG